MAILIRTIAIIIEVGILALVMYVLLNGVKLIVFDLGLGPKYRRPITAALFLVGTICVVFFIAHLISFYPSA